MRKASRDKGERKASVAALRPFMAPAGIVHTSPLICPSRIWRSGAQRTPLKITSRKQDAGGLVLQGWYRSPTHQPKPSPEYSSARTATSPEAPLTSRSLTVPHPDPAPPLESPGQVPPLCQRRGYHYQHPEVTRTWLLIRPASRLRSGHRAPTPCASRSSLPRPPSDRPES